MSAFKRQHEKGGRVARIASRRVRFDCTGARSKPRELVLPLEGVWSPPDQRLFRDVLTHANRASWSESHGRAPGRNRRARSGEKARILRSGGALGMAKGVAEHAPGHSTNAQRPVGEVRHIAVGSPRPGARARLLASSAKRRRQCTSTTG